MAKEKYSKGIRFYVTEACNANCPNCFNKEDRKNVSMDFDHFTKLCDYFSSNGYNHLKIMGGEPTTLDELPTFISYAQDKFENVSIFTNGINNNIEKLFLRATDRIIYNFKFNKLLTKEKLLLGQPGIRALEVQVTSKTDENKLFRHLESIVDLCPERIHVFFTIDCVSDIFKEHTDVVKKYDYLQNCCNQKKYITGQDHILPLCYIKNTSIPMPESGSFCSTDCAGLIDSSYNLKFCNQYPTILAKIFTENGMISFSDYNSLIQTEFTRLQGVNSIKGCNKCRFYKLLCNGGCFMSKDINSPRLENI